LHYKAVSEHKAKSKDVLEECIWAAC